jgi:hypothetical protein
MNLPTNLDAILHDLTVGLLLVGIAVMAVRALVAYRNASE